jgi:hypothetical protein
MKLFLLITFMAASTSAMANVEPWKEEMMCSTHGNTSSYVVEIGQTNDQLGTERELKLWKNHSDGSNRKAIAFGCGMNRGKLACKVGKATVIVDIAKPENIREWGANRFFGYKAELIISGLLGGTHLAQCTSSIRIR